MKTSGYLCRLVYVVTSMGLALSCGHSQQTSAVKIVRGHEVDARKYPAVSLQEVGPDGAYESFCTGVMLTPEFLLTAAHCSLGPDGLPSLPESVAVVASDNDPESSRAVRHEVAAITIESGYSHGAGDDDEDDSGIVKPGNARDIAVWQLRDPIPGVITASLLAASDLDAAFADAAPIVIMGYGKQARREKRYVKHNLHMAETKYFEHLGADPQDFSEHSEDIGGRTTTEFYAGAEGLPDTCNGDSGGPAFVKSASGRLLLAGVTSRGLPSCDRGGVYTLVPAYLDWIRTVVASLRLGRIDD
ncbi:MAG: trypsin-like serine protease [Deltaproteobacteria bacterium]|nr:trypsin-like serine protease [Deltaproteobacteria bacterium]